MKPVTTSIDRLLQAAATVPQEPGAEMPFGFDTRVLAQWRETLPVDLAAIATMLRRVVLTSLALIVLAGAGAYREWHNDDAGNAAGDDYTIADAAIGGVFDQ